MPKKKGKRPGRSRASGLGRALTDLRAGSRAQAHGKTRKDRYNTERKAKQEASE